MAEADNLYERAADLLRLGDAPSARKLFRRAGELGRRDSAVIYVNFLASGTGGTRDWPAALTLLRQLATVNPRSARELAVIDAMALTEEGDPRTVPEGEVICTSPYIVTFRNLFSVAECHYLVAAATPMFEPALVVDPRTGGQIPDPFRICDSCGFTAPLENPAVHALSRRLAAASETAVDQGETLQILRYTAGGEYKPHYDAIPGFVNQRTMTMLVWLNADYEGGETWFPEASLALKGQPGDGILFRNTGADGDPDPASAHAGRLVTAGEKIIASRWIRDRRFEPPVGGRAA